ncbi:hypothetical protein ACOMHN_056303 [Nucella lapillus]
MATSFRGSNKEEVKQVPTVLALHVLFSLLSHLAQVILSALLAFALYYDVTHRDVFFALTSGLTILPLVTLQLLSAIFLLRSHGDSMSGREAVLRAVTHVLQLGFVWRHLDLLQPKDASSRHRDLKELRLLRLVFALLVGFPLLLLQLYLTFVCAEFSWSWLLPISLSVSAVSCVWTVVNFRSSRQQQEPGRGGGTSWIEFVIRLLWRAGEVVSRMTSLGLFACLFEHWVLGVLGLHWIIMVIFLNIPHHSSSSSSKTTTVSFRTGKVLSGLLTSYSFLWCYVSLCDVRAVVWCVVYYVIVFLENGALCVVWLIQTEADGFVSRYLPVVVSGLAFSLAMLCVAVHHRHFHTNPSSPFSAAKAQSPQVFQKRSFRDWEDHHKCRTSQSAYLAHTSPRQNLLYFASGMARGGASETNIEEGRGSQLIDTDGRGSWLTLAGEGRGFWLDSASDCLSVNTASTAHLSVHTALNRSCVDSGCGRYRSPPPSSSAPLHCAVHGCVDSGHLPTSSSLCTLTTTLSAGHPRGYMPKADMPAQSDGYSTDHTIMEWSKLPVTPLADNVWNIHDTDTTNTDCCYSYLSPGDSEASCSSTMPAACGSRRGTGYSGKCTCAGGDPVYGIPRQHTHLPQKKETPQRTSSADHLQMKSSCCSLHQEKDLKRLYNQSSVFTVSSQHNTRCGSYVDYVNMSAPNSDGSISNIHHVVKKSKHQTRRKHQQNTIFPRSGSRHNRPLSVCSSNIISSTEGGSASSLYSRKKRKDRDLLLPTRLQVRAILPKSDEDIPAKVHTSSEPVYENVPVIKQKHPYSSSRKTSDNPLSVQKRQEIPCSISKTQENPCIVTMTEKNRMKKTRDNPHRTTISQQNTSALSTDNSITNMSETINTDQNYVNTDICIHHDHPFNRKSCTRQQKRLKKPTDITEKRIPRKTEQIQTNTNGTSRPVQEGERGRVRSSRSDEYPRQWLLSIGTQEAGGGGWGYSESEDSALPPETFSSSVEDGCMDSEDNAEFII